MRRWSKFVRRRMAPVLLVDPHGHHYGYDVAKLAHLPSPLVYPEFSRMLDEGWVTDGWQDQWGPNGKMLPPRRFYVLTEDGIQGLLGLLDKVTP